jgi:hypothetical protein
MAHNAMVCGGKQMCNGTAEGIRMKKLLVAFSAGCLGGLVCSLVLWQLSQHGILRSVDVAILVSLTPGWLYRRIVWGGIFGILFLLPMLGSRPLSKGFVVSLFPTAVQLFVVFPFRAHKGMAGLDLGLLTPLVVLVVNAVWGWTASLTIRISR